MRFISNAFIFSLSILLMLSSTIYSQQKEYENHIKSATFVSEKFEIGPGNVVSKALMEIEFPKGHIGVKSFDVDLIDEEGNSIPLYETYLHHWFVINFINKNVSHDHNAHTNPYEDAIFKRNDGTCNGGILPQYWGLGSESRGTSSKIPDPFAVEVGNPKAIPQGSEEKWLFSIMVIDTRGTENRKSCSECRCDQFNLPENYFNVTVDINGKPLSPDYKGGISNIPMDKGGYLIYGTAHMHSGVVIASLYGQDGKELCTSTPRYGTGKEAGNEEGYEVGIESRGTSSKIPDPFAVEVGNPKAIPQGWEEKWLFSIMVIGTRGTENRKTCSECRCDQFNLPENYFNVTVDINGKPLSPDYKGGIFCCHDNFQCKLRKGFEAPRRNLALRYKVTWVDWDEQQIPARFYILDSTDRVKTIGSQIIHDCQSEYTIPENNGDDPFHVQKANIPMDKGGYLIYGTAHMHSGVVNASLYGQC
uniref:Uncharacterized protein LOC101513451 n=1 Tax=Cicer arietinum TaxID=3827 RepID=A0A3Q7YH35_CICAR|nr:uncharacterized protein LOC101513451 [Cicer arietinum]